ncbi:MAG: S4 domain-containing protein, partial [Anaerolineae bacterium]
EQMLHPDYIPNTAQRRLAEEVTRLVHGEAGLQTALKVTSGAAPGAKTTLDPQVLKEIASDMPSFELYVKEILDHKYTDLAAQIALVPSRSEAAKLIKNGGAYLNNEKIEDPQYRLSEKDIVAGEYLLFGAGKKKKILVNLRKDLQ